MLSLLHHRLWSCTDVDGHTRKYAWTSRAWGKESDRWIRSLNDDIPLFRKLCFDSYHEKALGRVSVYLIVRGKHDILKVGVRILTALPLEVDC
jgi:hypothetical protein